MITRSNIFKKLLSLMILASLIAGIAVASINIYQETRLENEYLIKENKLIAELTANVIEAGSLNASEAATLLKNIKESEGILFWQIVDSNGTVKLASDYSMQDEPISDEGLKTKNFKILEIFFNKTNEKIKLISQPLAMEEDYTLYFGVSLNRISTLKKRIILNTSIMIVILIFFAFYVSFFLTKRVTKPINSLLEGVNFISKGDLNHSIEIKAKDEFGQLALAFNQMTKKLKETRMRNKLINQMKSDFISIAAHQLRTPITGIKWTMRMLLDGDVGKLNSEQQDLLAKGYESNERIIRLITDLLNVTRIEEGRFGFTFKKYDFMEVLEDVLQNMDGLIKQKKIKIDIKEKTELPELYLDKQKMALALTNVLDNSIKYSPENSKVIITLSATSKNFKISIKDSGIGIQKADLKRIFSKFFRGSNVVRLQTEGSGLGLFITKNIIENHNGTITLKSKEGKGTEVLLNLSLNEDDYVKNLNKI